MGRPRWLPLRGVPLSDLAIERFLEEQYASLAEAEPSAYVESAHEGAVSLTSALVELDLLSPEERDRWAARFARAIEDPLDRPLANPDLRRKATEYIERCLAETAREDEEDSGSRWRIYGALEAFVEIGLLTGHDFERWHERLWHRDEAVSDGQDSWDALSRFEMTHLVRVVPGPEERLSGLRVTVVELYQDGVSVQWHRAPGVDTRRHLRALASRAAGRRRLGLLDDPPVRLADELGTAYAWGGGGSTHGSTRGQGELGHTDFVPAVPKQVRRLRVEIDDHTLEIPL